MACLPLTNKGCSNNFTKKSIPIIRVIGGRVEILDPPANDDYKNLKGNTG